MGGSHSKPVTVDISYYPGSAGGQVKKDDKGYYYESNSGRVDLTDEWYPDLEGTYRKFTHTPEKGKKIGKIKKENSDLTEFTSLEKYSSVSVYYWSLDNTFKNPLLIQLGNEDEYYKHASPNHWTVDQEASTSKLRDSLNKQNCERNQVHIVDLSKKGNNPYQCPGSCGTVISVKSTSISNYSDSAYTIPDSGTFSVTSFKDGDSWQRGLPSVKDARTIKVTWKTSGETPLLSATQRQQRWFRRNAEDKSTWIEVTAGQNDLPNGETLNLTLNLSNLANRPYTDNDVKITVIVSHIGDGYYRYQHSLCGEPFKVTEIKHGTTLSGLSSQGTLSSISTVT